jgi:hypothetical protein
MADNALPFPHPRHRPTQAEILFHKRVIEGLERDIIDVMKELDVLQGTPQFLQSRLQLLQQRRANHASYISPLRNLPPEVLVEIVHICLYNDVGIMTLTQICGTLRDVVIGTPTFWKCIRLEPPTFGQVFRYEYDPEVSSLFIQDIQC